MLTHTYEWKAGQVVKYHTEDERGYRFDATCTYGEGFFRESVTDTDNPSSEPEVTTIRQRGGTYLVEKTDGHYYDYDGPRKLIREVQEMDVQFVRPNIMQDIEGFTPDSLVLVSKAGRVVCCVNSQHSSSWGDYDHYDEWGLDDKPHYYNISTEDYFRVERSADNTFYCYNIDDELIFVVRDNKLIKEYAYYDIYSEVGGTSSPDNPGSRATADDARPYDETTYLYDERGNFCGCSVVDVDTDGTRSETMKVEYKYDPSTGISSPELSTTAGFTLTGRTLGLTAGGTFSVYTLQGQLLADNVTRHTFASAGIYVVNAQGGQSLKLRVK